MQGPVRPIRCGHVKLIAGSIDCDEGRRTIQPGTRVVLLEQEPAMAGAVTLMDYVLSGSDAPPRST